MDNESLAVKLFNLEQKLASENQPADDVQKAVNVCKKIRNLMLKIKTAKEDAGTGKKKDIEKLRLEVCLNFAGMKRINRMMHLRNKQAKDATEAAKQLVDASDLQLQNLLCEKMHLKREIQKCQDFKSRDETIALAPEEEFYEQAPADVSRKEVTMQDEHQRRLARLDWELKERQRLSEQVAKSEAMVKSLKDEAKGLSARLASLKPKLQDVIKATRPVQQHLGLLLEQREAQHHAARLLPRPLYVLYVLVEASRQAVDPNIELSVEGDVESAATLDEQLWDQEEESDSDEERETLTSNSKAKKRHGEQREKLLEQRKRLLRTHPLGVTLNLPCQGGLTLQLSFQYVLRLRVVCVSGQLQGSLPALAASASELLTPQSLLTCLSPGDTGFGCPGPSAQLLLERVSLKDINAFDPSLGRPYGWVQQLAGLDLLTTDGQSSLVSGSSHVVRVLQQLQKRLASRLSLQKQLVALEDRVVSVSAGAQHLFPSKVHTSISGWERCKHTPSHCEELVARGFFSKTDTLFTLEARRADARLTCHVSLSPGYPQQAPVFGACMTQAGNSRHRANSAAIRDMEAEVNLYYNELCDQPGLSRDELLTNQIQRLLVAMDIYVESGAHGADSEPCALSIPKPHAGRSRARPFRYQPSYRLCLPR